MTPTIPVTNGLFTTLLDFGLGTFDGEARWLDMQVSCPTGGAFTALNPRQALTPAPMALALPGLWTQQKPTSPNLIGGYSGNLISPILFGATIGGGGVSGFPNRAWANFATVGGGNGNTASGQFAAIPGGDMNSATMTDTLAAGHRAKANHSGAFVWADSTDVDLASNAPNQFLVRAVGGVLLWSNAALNTGCSIPAGGGSWNCTSDRSVKMNFASVDGREVLARLASIPVETWSYKTQDASIRHMGPMAQDFHVAFGVGENDTTISTVDAQGVALVAIQGLNQIVQAQDARLAAQQQPIDDLRTRLSSLVHTPSTGGMNSSAAPTGLSPEWIVIGALVLMNGLLLTVAVVFLRRGARA